MKWKVVSSSGAEPAVCLERCIAQLEAEEIQPDLLLVFAGQYGDWELEEAANRLGSRFPGAMQLGGTVDGLVAGGQEWERDGGLALVAAELPGVRLTPYQVDFENSISPDAPPQEWHQRFGPPDTQAQIVLSDPFSFQVEPLLSGLDYAYADAVTAGGLVSGSPSSGRNALLIDGRVHHGGAVGLALAGNLRAESGVAQGCRPIGPPMVITECEQNGIFELDGEPASRALVQVLTALLPADRALARHHLFVGIGAHRFQLEYGPGDFLIRDVIGVEPERQMLVVGALVRKGQVLQFHLRDEAASRQDLEQVLGRCSERWGPRPPDGALLFSCVGRGEGLYRERSHDSQRFREAFGEVPLGGFFGNGEIGQVGGSTYLHGYTSCFVLFGPP